jgi:arabinofuranan 3-O-arabinosyltransferase
MLAVTALIFVAGGPVALVVPVLAYLAGRPARSSGPAMARDPGTWMPVLACAAMLTSGLLSAVRPFGAGMFGPFGSLAQVLALVALAAALTPAVAVRPETRADR